MTPFYSDSWLTIYAGDCRAVLAELPDESVHCVVTSPPYWGLRDYGTATWIGGDEGCDHAAAKKKTRYDYALDSSPIQQGSRTGTDAQPAMYAHECPACGAVRQDSQLGLEPTPEQYVADLVAVFREVRRVLRRDGTLWLNLGDSYASGWSTSRVSKVGLGSPPLSERRDRLTGGLKEKDLVGIPWRVAFALQADGWYLRSDIIWAKPNPMPESVTDRPTKAHEYLFLLSKSARYYYDQDAVREPQSEESNGSYRRALASPRQPADWKQNAAVEHIGAGPTVSPNAAWSDPEKLERLLSRGRNLRSVWTIPTRPYPGAHFAVFPPELPERCIKAGTSERGVCPECGAPWERQSERPVEPEGLRNRGNGAKLDYHTRQTGSGQKLQDWMDANPKVTTGWRPVCQCLKPDDWNAIAEPEPAVILDPFAGSGTVGMVAAKLSRRAVLIDLNPEYLKQQLVRNAQTPLGLGA